MPPHHTFKSLAKVRALLFVAVSAAVISAESSLSSQVDLAYSALVCFVETKAWHINCRVACCNFLKSERKRTEIAMHLQSHLYLHIPTIQPQLSSPIFA